MKTIILAITILSASINTNALSRDYYNLSAHDKREFIWRNILKSSFTPYAPLRWQGWLSLYIELNKFLNQRKDIQEPEDVNSARQMKIMFSHGSVAKVIFFPNGISPYSGIFSRQSIGLARFSLLADPKGVGSYIPNMGIKFFIDESPSVNICAMDSFAGQGQNNNWFLRPLSNVIKESPMGLFAGIEKIMSSTLPLPNYLPIEALSLRAQNGRLLFNPKAPYEIVFEPSDQVKQLISPHTTRDFREELAKIPEKSVLYVVRAREYPEEALETIGFLISESPFVASDYGDMRFNL